MIYSKNNSKSLWVLLITALALIFLATLRITIFNSSFFGLNLLLILILILILAKYNKSALLFGWILGFLTDTASFSVFGVNSLVFLITAATLIIIYRTTFFTLKTENVIFMALLTVFLYRLTHMLISNGLALLNRGNFESFSFYFVNWNFLSELITTVILTLIILKFFRTFFGNESR